MRNAMKLSPINLGRRGAFLSVDVLNSLKDLLFVFDEDFHLVLWNSRVNDVTGYSDSELTSLRVDHVCSETDIEILKKTLEKAGASSLEIAIITKDGHKTPCHFTFTPFKSRNDAITGFCGVGKEISTHDELYRKGHYYNRLFYGMLTGFCHCEIISNRDNVPIDARFLDVNPAFERMIGHERNRIIHRTAGDVLPGFESFWTSMFNALTSSDQPVHSVFYLEGRDTYFETTSFSPDADQLITIFTDITESKRVREENKTLQSQLFQAQKMEDIGRLAGGIAHDFNNLLTAIHGYTDLALMQKDNEKKLKESLEQISLATGRAAQLAQQLLFFSKQETDKRVPGRINDIVSEINNMLKRIIGEHITVSLDLNQDLWMSMVNQGQIEQIIMNLAINARDAMKGGGKLTISTKNVHIDKENLNLYPSGRSGRFICIAVEDTGTGMSRETIGQIFKPFFTTKGKNQGTGLGLSVVNGIVKGHHGWINVYSEEGLGTTFKIYIPANNRNEFFLEEKTEVNNNLRGRGERILFVDDDSTIRNFMKTQLKDYGYTVFTADNVQEALELCKRKHYHIDLLFTDAVLPDKKGTDLIDSLINHNPEIKIILTSGYSGIGNETNTRGGGHFQFINKPYSLKDALCAIRETLDV
jgi:PAS domain S-box-containing protein